jgi:hypothetical protein
MAIAASMRLLLTVTILAVSVKVLVNVTGVLLYR